MKLLLVIAALFAMIGCSTDLKCEIESNTSWSGAIGNSTKAGNGNASYSIKSGDGAVVQKQTSEGVLTVKIVSKDNLFGDETKDEGTTSAPYGVVSVIDK